MKSVSDLKNLFEDNKGISPISPPVMLILRRVGLRGVGGMQIGLYWSEQLKRYITIPDRVVAVNEFIERQSPEHEQMQTELQMYIDEYEDGNISEQEMRDVISEMGIIDEDNLLLEVNFSRPVVPKQTIPTKSATKKQNDRRRKSIRDKTRHNPNNSPRVNKRARPTGNNKTPSRLEKAQQAAQQNRALNKKATEAPGVLKRLAKGAAKLGAKAIPAIGAAAAALDATPAGTDSDKPKRSDFEKRVEATKKANVEKRLRARQASRPDNTDSSEPTQKVSGDDRAVISQAKRDKARQDAAQKASDARAKAQEKAEQRKKDQQDSIRNRANDITKARNDKALQDRLKNREADKKELEAKNKEDKQASRPDNTSKEPRGNSPEDREDVRRHKEDRAKEAQAKRNDLERKAQRSADSRAQVDKERVFTNDAGIKSKEASDAKAQREKRREAEASDMKKNTTSPGKKPPPGRKGAGRIATALALGAIAARAGHEKKPPKDDAEDEHDEVENKKSTLHSFASERGDDRPSLGRADDDDDAPTKKKKVRKEGFGEMNRKNSIKNLRETLENDDILEYTLEDDSVVSVDEAVFSAMVSLFEELDETNQETFLEMVGNEEGFFLIADFAINR